MLNRKRIFRKLLWLIAFQQSLACIAQTKADSIVHWQQVRQAEQWMVTVNPVFITQQQVPDYGLAALGFTTESGAYRRPMDATQKRLLQPSVEGLRKIKGIIIAGSLNYQKQNDDGLGWSNVYDAYEGTPLLWADSGNGNWLRDHINASVTFVAPAVLQKWKLGLRTDYQIGTGARNTDPKPFYRYRNIVLTPGISRQFQKHTIGVSGTASFLQEENEVGFFANNNVLLYRMRGFGLYSRTPFVSGERKRTGWQARADLQYQYACKSGYWMVNAFAGTGDEEVSEGVSLPITTGYYQPITAGISAGKFVNNFGSGSRLQMHYTYRAGYADDVIVRAETASRFLHRVSGEWSKWTSKENRVIQMSVLPGFEFSEQVDQATRMQMTVSRVMLDVKLLWRKSVTKNLTLQVQPTAGYYHTADMFFSAAFANVVTNNLQKPYFDYLSANLLHSSINALGDITPSKSNVTHRLQLTAQMDNPINNNNFSKSRNQLNIKYAFIF